MIQDFISINNYSGVSNEEKNIQIDCACNGCVEWLMRRLNILILPIQKKIKKPPCACKVNLIYYALVRLKRWALFFDK